MASLSYLLMQFLWPIASKENDLSPRRIMFHVWHMLNTHLYSEELPAEEVLRLRVFLLRLARLRPETSPPSQVEQQYGAASTLTSSPPSISDSQAASKLTGHTNHWQSLSLMFTGIQSCVNLDTQTDSPDPICHLWWKLRAKLNWKKQAI